MKNLQKKIYNSILSNINDLSPTTGAAVFIQDYIEPVIPLWDAVKNKIQIILSDYLHIVQQAQNPFDSESLQQSTAREITELFSVNWECKEGFIYNLQNGNTVAMLPYFDKSNPRHLQNQKLIAAAPQMLDLLMYIEDEIETTPDSLSDALLGLIRIKCTNLLNGLNNA